MGESLSVQIVRLIEAHGGLTTRELVELIDPAREGSIRATVSKLRMYSKLVPTESGRLVTTALEAQGAPPPLVAPDVTQEELGVALCAQERACVPHAASVGHVGRVISAECVLRVDDAELVVRGAAAVVARWTAIIAGVIDAGVKPEV
jgi:hypothetical protein